MCIYWYLWIKDGGGQPLLFSLPFFYYRGNSCSFGSQRMATPTSYEISSSRGMLEWVARPTTTARLLGPFSGHHRGCCLLKLSLSIMGWMKVSCTKASRLLWISCKTHLNDTLINIKLCSLVHSPEATEGIFSSWTFKINSEFSLMQACAVQSWRA